MEADSTPDVRWPILADNSGYRLHETGTLYDNPLGLKDAPGNIKQWSSSYQMPFNYPETSYENPIDVDELAKQNPPTGAERVNLGGAWYTRSNQLWRDNSPNERDTGLGFRVLRTFEE